jgi:hypothetical protein
MDSTGRQTLRPRSHDRLLQAVRFSSFPSTTRLSRSRSSCTHWAKAS